jgi:hypothetical protein
MVYSGAWGKLIYEKNLKSKISDFAFFSVNVKEVRSRWYMTSHFLILSFFGFIQTSCYCSLQSHSFTPPRIEMDSTWHKSSWSLLFLVYTDYRAYNSRFKVLVSFNDLNTVSVPPTSSTSHSPGSISWYTPMHPYFEVFFGRLAFVSFLFLSGAHLWLNFFFAKAVRRKLLWASYLS